MSSSTEYENEFDVLISSLLLNFKLTPFSFEFADLEWREMIELTLIIVRVWVPNLLLESHWIQSSDCLSPSNYFYVFCYSSDETPICKNEQQEKIGWIEDHKWFALYLRWKSYVYEQSSTSSTTAGGFRRCLVVMLGCTNCWVGSNIALLGSHLLVLADIRSDTMLYKFHKLLDWVNSMGYIYASENTNLGVVLCNWEGSPYIMLALWSYSPSPIYISITIDDRSVRKINLETDTDSIKNNYFSPSQFQARVWSQLMNYNR